MSSPHEHQPHVPASSEGLSASSVATRIWDATKKLITITDYLKSLEKEDSRIQTQVLELSRMVIDLIKEVRELSGQMKGIEKRFDDKDKMIEAVIRVKVSEELEKALSKVNHDLHGGSVKQKATSRTPRKLVQKL